MPALLLVAALLLSQNVAVSASHSVKEEFIVKVSSQVSLSDLKRTLPASEARYIDRARSYILIKSKKSLRDLNRISSVRDRRIEYVEPNYIYRIQAVPNDPEYKMLWGLKNSGQTIKDTVGKAGVDIQAEKAWDITVGSHNVVVAVIDTGIDYTIADLKENIWINQKELSGQKGFDDDGNGYIDDVYGYDFFNNDGDPKDDHGHGSHVGGTIGATGDNKTGVVGVNWKVQLMAVKFLGSNGTGTTEAAIKAVDYAVANNVNIINASWGGGDYSKALEDSLKNASEKGILFVASAGNSGRNTDVTPSYPASYEADNVLSVAAVDNTGAIAYFSNYGKKSVDLGAPGFNVLSTTIAGIEYFSGTSMAAPHVAGVAALLLSKEPNLSVAQIRERLLSTSKILTDLKGKTATGGLLNAYNALTNQFDPEDPKRWVTRPFELTSTHPYLPNSAVKYEVKAPAGTKAFAIHFSKFETEERFDVVKIYDEKGALVGKISGDFTGEYSGNIEGDKAVLELVSDAGNEKFGFEIDLLAIRP
jgi:thermitase